MLEQLSTFSHDDSGATSIEYGLIAAIISLVIVAALKSVRTDLQSAFTSVSNGLQAANALN